MEAGAPETESPVSGISDLVSVAALLAASEAARISGRYSEGAALGRQVLTRTGADPRGHAEGLRLVALCLTRDGEPELAVATAGLAIEAFRALDERHRLSEMLTAQAYAYTLLGLSTEALDALTESRAIAQELGDPDLLFWVYSRLGNVHNQMGGAVQAQGFLLQAYRRCAGLHREAHFSINNNLALNAFYIAKELRAAGQDSAETLSGGMGHASTAVELGEQLANPFLTGTALMNLAMLQALDGDTALAADTLARSISMAVEGGYRSLEASAKQCLAEVLLLEGDPLAATTLIGQVLHLAVEIGERSVELELLALLSDAQEQLGDYQAALMSYKRFHALDVSIRSELTAIRARLLGTDLELDGARAEAQRARQESEVDRAKAEALQADHKALQEHASELYETSLRDALTGLGNRRQLESILPIIFETANAERTVMCLAVIDIDRFKRVNDTYGHAVGDRVLIRVAELLARSARRGDLVGRLGGEEFLIAFPGLDLGAAQSICERLRVAITQEDWSWLAPDEQITVSIGLQPMLGCDDVWQQVDRADRAMYRAKQSGRNQVSVSAPERKA